MSQTKEIEIYHPVNSTLFAMRFVGGGQIPSELEGVFTDFYSADRQRQLYYNRRQIKNAAKKSKSQETVKTPFEG